MILEEETYKEFGYYSWELSSQSNKKIVAKCDDCGKIRKPKKYSYRPLCSKCVRKGKRNINYGKTLPKDTREKMAAAKNGKYRGEKSPHWKGGKVKCVCHICGIVFKVQKHETINGRRKYCSMKCCNIGKRDHRVSEEHKQKLSDVHSGKNNWNWQGGKSFEPYCNRFTFKFKEKIREKYNRKCYFCGKSEEGNGERLCVHHVDGDKEQGCNGKQWFVIPLCRSCHTHLHNQKIKKVKSKTQN